MNIALYRRYRPDTFATVIGQEQVTRPLMAALDAGRINHAYLFSGPRGCGKTTCARIMARCLNCTQGPTANPCGQCPSCQELATGASGSLDVVEIDAASHNGVDDARELRERAAFAPVRDRFKIFILDEAHMVTSQGFNALLKLVEEPPEHVKFIFATTEPEKVIGTIRSRTHHYPFRLVAPDILRSFLADLCSQEKITVDEGVLELVIRAGGGSVRDSLSVLDQLMAGAKERNLDYQSSVGLLGYTDSTLLQDVIDAIIDQDATALFKQLENVIESGLDPRRFLEDLLLRLRDLMLLGFSGAEIASLSTLPQVQLEYMHTQVQRWNPGAIARAADLTATTITGMTGTVAPRLQIELLGAKLLAPSSGGGNPVVGQNLPNGDSASHVAPGKDNSGLATVSVSPDTDIEASMAAARAALAASRTQVSTKQKLETAPTISGREPKEQVSGKPEEVSLQKSKPMLHRQVDGISGVFQSNVAEQSQTGFAPNSPITVEVDTNPTEEGWKDSSKIKMAQESSATPVIKVSTTYQDRLRSKMPLWEYQARREWPNFLVAVEEKSRKLFCVLNLVCEPRFDEPNKIEIVTRDSSARVVIREQQRFLESVAKVIYPESVIVVGEKYYPQQPLAIDFYQKLQDDKPDNKDNIDTHSWLKQVPVEDELTSDSEANQSVQTEEVKEIETGETTCPTTAKSVMSDYEVAEGDRKPTENQVGKLSTVESHRPVVERSTINNEHALDSDWIITEPDSESGLVGTPAAITKNRLEKSSESEPGSHPESTKGDNFQFVEGVPATDWVTGTEPVMARVDDLEPVKATQETSKNNLSQLGKPAIRNDEPQPVEKCPSEEDEISFDDEDAEPLITDVDQVIKQVLRAKKIEEINLQE